MTLKEYAAWCLYFRQQLMRDDDPVDFLDDWRKDVARYALTDAKEAVLHCVRTASRFDKSPKLLLGKICDFLEGQQSARNVKSRMATLNNNITTLPDNERGDVWEKSPRRQQLLARLSRPNPITGRKWCEPRDGETPAIAGSIGIAS